MGAGGRRCPDFKTAREREETNDLALGAHLGTPLPNPLPLGLLTVAEIEVDQSLVRDTSLFGEPLEILHGRMVEANRNALLEPLRVGILLRLREVVFCSHRSPQAILVLERLRAGRFPRGDDPDYVSVS